MADPSYLRIAGTVALAVLVMYDFLHRPIKRWIYNYRVSHPNTSRRKCIQCKRTLTVCSYFCNKRKPKLCTDCDIFNSLVPRSQQSKQ